MRVLGRLGLYLNGALTWLAFAGCMVPPPVTAVLSPSPAPSLAATTALPSDSPAPPETSTATEAGWPTQTSTATLLPLILSPTPSPTPAPLRFAVIGDYGTGLDDEAEVAALVESWEPDFIITTGDNNYPSGSAETIDAHLGQFYHGFIYPYVGDYGEGADINRFFPSLGNHDWDTSSAQPYLDYFDLPGNERYYDFTWGAVHFFALDSDTREPDGVGSSSKQAEWLKAQLAASTEPFNIIYMHHAPYSSGLHGSIDWMQWPFAEWGADLVLAGHDHTYERIEHEGIFYVVNGVGGASIYPFGVPVEGSQVRYNEAHGAMLVEAGEASLHIEFVNSSGDLIDQFEAPLARD